VGKTGRFKLSPCAAAAASTHRPATECVCKGECVRKGECAGKGDGGGQDGHLQLGALLSSLSHTHTHLQLGVLLQQREEFRLAQQQREARLPAAAYQSLAIARH
jgi:hypothetical protein